ncbi:MAG: SIS domain-containing protein [Defluviitaleaceae bacterium]|nr:SIS domain-containing protein [Defluviitaleaceae bacterium]MCL2274369.1 SIS domain-containing protein [Defluviitaleaceae bacterium]
MEWFRNFYGVGHEFFEEKKCGFTACEIAHQPQMWRDLAKDLKAQEEKIAAFMVKLGALKDVRIVLTGAGSSGFVGRAVAGFAAQLCGVYAEAIHTTDIVSAPEMYFPAGIRGKKTLLISFARSGNSPESVGAVEYARKMVKDLYEIAIVCDGTSKLANASRETDKQLVLVMPEGTNDKGFAMTSSVSSMMLAGIAVLCAERYDEICAEIPKIAEVVEKRGQTFANSAKEYAAFGFERAWYLGSGANFALVQEGALKMMELTNGQVVSGCNSATEFRHGPKTVMNDKTLTIHFISPNAFTQKYDEDLLKELYEQRNGNWVVALGITHEKIEHHVLEIEAGFAHCADIAVGLQGLVFMQLLSMFTSLQLGVPTDNPSPSGLVNRVVQGVTVYPYKGGA